jgi:hypothetical protein
LRDEEHVEHWAGLFFELHEEQVESQNWNKMHPLLPSYVYPSGQSFTHLSKVGCLLYGPVFGQSLLKQ